MAKKNFGKQQAPQASGGKTLLALIAVVGALALVVAGVIVLAGSGQTTAGASAGTGPGATGARVEVDQEQLDFGQVKMDTPVRAAFKIRNVGTEPLQVLGEPQVRVVEGC